MVHDHRHRPSAARGRPGAYLLHSLLGLKLSLFVLFVCATGTIAVVSDELEWLYRDEVRASSATPAASWGTRYAAARAAFPDYTIDFAAAGEEPYLATRFLATSRSGETRVVYVDPATGRVAGESGWVTLRSVMRALHYYLFVPGDWGFYAVAALGFVLLGLLVSGLLVYKRFWRGFFRMPRRRSGIRIFWGDVHRLVGLWSTWFVLVIAVTSVWYLAERLLYRAEVDFDRPPTAIPDGILDRLGPEPPAWRPVDELVATARRALPGLRVRSIAFPERPDQPLSVRGQTDAWLVRDRANNVDLDPHTGTVLAISGAEGMDVVERWSHTADLLHFGSFGGLAAKLVWVVFGLAMCMSAASGATVFVARSAVAARELRSESGPGVGWRLARLDFMGGWKWPGVATVAVVPLLAYTLSWRPSLEPDDPGPSRLEPAVVGRWTAVVATDPPLEWPAGALVRWRVRFCAGCYPEIRAAFLAYADEQGAAWRKVRLSGGTNRLAAILEVPGDADRQRHLKLIVRSWDGGTHVAVWPLGR